MVRCKEQGVGELRGEDKDGTHLETPDHEGDLLRTRLRVLSIGVLRDTNDFSTQRGARKRNAKTRDVSATHHVQDRPAVDVIAHDELLSRLSLV